MKRYVLLDRDGTLVRNVGYPHRLEDYELLAGVCAALRRLADAGYRLAIVTNQSGIGRGYFSFSDYQRFHARLLSDLSRARIEIDATFLCPHAPDAGCACRKPAAGLLWRARDELGADLASSWLVGDAESDIEAARRAGCGGAVRVGVAAPQPQRDPLAFEARDLGEAADRILGYGAP